MSTSTNLAGLTAALALMATNYTPAYAFRAEGSSAPCPSCTTTAPAVPAPTKISPRHRRAPAAPPAPATPAPTPEAPAAPATPAPASAAPASAPSAAVAPTAPFSCEGRAYLPAADYDHDNSVTANELLTYFSRQADGNRQEARRLLRAEGLNPRELRNDRRRVVCSLPAAVAASAAPAESDTPRIIEFFDVADEGNISDGSAGTAPAGSSLEAALARNRDEILAGVQQYVATTRRAATRSAGAYQPLGLSLGIGPGILVYDKNEVAGTIEGRVGYDLNRWFTLQVSGGRIFNHQNGSSPRSRVERTHSDPADNAYGYFTESDVQLTERQSTAYDSLVQVGVMAHVARRTTVGVHAGLLLGDETSQESWRSRDQLYAADGSLVGQPHQGSGVREPVVRRTHSAVAGVDLEQFLKLGRTAAVTHQLRLHLTPEYDFGQDQFNARVEIDYGIKF